MPSPTVVRYRTPRARIAVAYSTKDRVDLTRITISPLLDDPALDLYWFDGSATEAGRELPFELCAGHRAICQLHQGVVGGPDCAIMYALQTLRGYSYDFVILVENDVLLADGWLEAMYSSIERAETAGFKVGAATVRVFDRRVLSFNGTYCLMLNSGAGFIALKPKAINLVLAHYRTIDGTEFIWHIQNLTGKDMSASVEFVAGQRLSVDFIFDLVLYWHGYVVAAPAVTFAHMIDGVLPRSVSPVMTPDDHMPGTRSLFTRPDQIRNPDYPFPRLQPSMLSDRSLIACQQLRIDVNPTEATQPVRAEGAWRRIWLQGLGPFGLSGTGTIRIAMRDAPVGLMLCSQEASELRTFRWDGSQLSAFSLQPNGLAEISLIAEDAHAQDIVLEVVSGKICLIGLTTDTSLSAEYANDYPTVDHLPF